MKKEVSLKDVWAYIQGNIRFTLYYSKYFKWLIPTHISEQIGFRIFVMDEVCYISGSCQMCGCETPALQMANKACKKPCYPEMMNKKEWKIFKKENYEKLGF
jgi:hypothetical protein